MTEDGLFQELVSVLEPHNQGHLLAFWPDLTPEKRAYLAQAVRGLDLPLIDHWITDYVKSEASINIPSHFDPAPVYTAHPTDPSQQEKYAQARARGRELIAAGKVGAFVVAGGQGTRLGFDGPKGNYAASPIKTKSLFQLFAEAILAVRQRYQTQCPWYIMTSPLNHQETVEIFKARGYFSLPEEDVFIFQQGTLPNFGFDGQILMTEKDTLAQSPDGHGGSLKALFDSDAITDMKARNVEYLSYWQVDNPLINIFDPLFIGLHVLDQAEMSSKAIKKTSPKEKVGNFCLVDDKVTVVEYSDLPDPIAEQRDADGKLLFEMGSIGIHLINRDFIETLNQGGFGLPLHRAVKKIPFVGPTGQCVDPETPNGVKLETFVFDALPLAKHSIILETERAEEFAPIKNAIGVDSAESSRQMMIDRAARWLESAGVNVPRKPTGEVACDLEIAASFALEPKDLLAKRESLPVLKPGHSYYLE
ncbi:UTP--glucose-1-phosphate uridylyltransferase [Planctomycetota bacterium]